MSGTINGLPLLRATVNLPRSGIWHADAQVQSGDTLTGQVTIELGGLVLVGTVEDGAPYLERGWYRVIGGKGGWRKPLPARGYRNEAGVKLSTVVMDAAREAGEDLGAFTERRIGPGFVRPTAEGSRVLDLLCPDAWYVDERGVTQIGTRPASPYALPYVLMDSRPDRLRITVAAEDLTGLVPGATLEGLEAASVRHELTPDGLRSHIFGRVGAMDRLLRGLKAVVGVLTHSTFYYGRYEFRVLSATGTHLDIAPARAAQGLPELRNVVMRCGSPGAAGTPAVGSLCDVMFLDGDPCRPVVVGYEGRATDGFEPEEVFLAQGAGRVIRSGDVVTLTNFQTAPGGGPVASTGPGLGIISLDSTNLAINQGPGSPGTGFSKVKA